MTKNDDLWAELAQRIPIDFSRPLTVLTDRQIKAVLGGRRDLRLLVSMDTYDKLADVLRLHDSFVLPKSRSEWAVVRGKGYQSLDDPGEPERFPSRLPIRLTTTAYGHGESSFLFHAFNSGLLDHFAGERLFPTIAGKGSTPAFHFRIDAHVELDVEGAGMEIDQGFESQESVQLFEAKVGWKNTFLIRQLYYPFRSHQELQRAADSKRVRPFFFVAEPNEGTYSLWEYEWSDESDYEAIRLVKTKRFKIEEGPARTDLLVSIPPDPSVPEFQANDLNKVTALPFLVRQGVNTARRWAEYYGFALRQGNYYESAAEALGLVESEEGTFVLTNMGRRFVTLPPQERDTLVAERLLKIPTINRVFALARDRGAEGVGDSDIARVIGETRRLSGATPPRRASSIRAYFCWLAQTMGVAVVEDQRIYSREGWEERRS